MAFLPLPLRPFLLVSGWAGVALLTGCRRASPPGAARPAAPVASESADPAPPPISANFEQPIREILALARAGKWIEAEAKAAELKRDAPHDPAVERLHAWVETEGQRRRDRALETEFRQIEAQDSRFANKLTDVLLDPDARSLDLPRSLRGALDDVEKASNIPEPYGRTIERTAPMVGLTEQAPG